MTIKLVHPDEDLSLEELRMNLPKYKTAFRAQSGPGAMMGAGMQRPPGMAPPGPAPPMGYASPPMMRPPMPMAPNSHY